MLARIASRRFVSSRLGGAAPPCGRGVTLIELLVVIAILMLITASAIPIVAPSIQQRRVREATRLVSSYLAAARSRAIESGRPVGVIFERYLAPGSTAAPQSYCMNLAMAQSQPPYAGDYTNSTAAVAYNGAQLEIIGFPNGDLVTNQNICVGDRIRLNGRVPDFVLTQAGATTYLAAPSTTAPWLLWTESALAVGALPVTYYPPPLLLTATVAAPAPVSFQIFRRPVRSADPPLQLPEGIVIDMQWSGMATAAGATITNLANGTTATVSGVFTQQSNPIVSFAPTGALDMVYDVGFQRPTGALFLLLGRSDQVGAFPSSATPAGFTQTNLGDINSLWVAVSQLSGQVTVNPNYNPGYSVAVSVAAFAASGGGTPTFGPNYGYVGFGQYVQNVSGGGGPSDEVLLARTLASGAELPSGATSPVTTLGGN